MTKLAVFDIDGTLAQLNKSVTLDVINNLKELSKKGVKICLSSGKPTAYIAGLCRQLGLDDVIIVGENGANIYFSPSLPPSKEIKLYTNDMLNITNDLKKKIDDQNLENIWFQPNQINITCFYTNMEDRAKINEILLDDYDAYRADLDYFIHSDCIEFVHKKLNKGHALEFLMDKLSLKAKDTISIGDSSNDFPMFEVSGKSIGIKLDENKLVTYNCNDINEAFKLIMKEI